MTSQLHELANYDRVLRFKGERIAHATSRQGQDADRIRWTEVDVYRTEGGQYVVHKVGKSRVFHGGERPCAGTGAVKTTARQVHYRYPAEFVVDLTPCPVCKPGELLELQPSAAVMVEQDRGVTSTSKTGQGVVEAAHSQDGDGVVYLTRVAEQALREASAVDDPIRDAFLVEEVA